jgi:hypothetical protein
VRRQRFVESVNFFAETKPLPTVDYPSRPPERVVAVIFQPLDDEIPGGAVVP